MAEVRVTQSAPDFTPDDAKRRVDFLVQIFFGDRLPETRPTRSGIELRAGVEQRVAAIDAAIEPGCVLVVQRSAESPFGRGAPRHVVLEWRKLLLPLVFCLDHPRQSRGCQPRA